MTERNITTAGGYARILLKKFKLDGVTCRDCSTPPYQSYSGFQKHCTNTGHNIVPYELIVRKNVYHGLCIHNEHSFLVTWRVSGQDR